MYDKSKTYRVTTSKGVLMYHLNWDNDGSIIMENSKTVKRYWELYEEHPDATQHSCFFAFSDKQFEEGKENLIKAGKLKEGEKIYSAAAGLFGTFEGLNSFAEAYENKDKKIRKECDPQEVYFTEYNNHECMYSDDSDAYEIVRNIWGEEIASNIKRIGKVRKMELMPDSLLEKFRKYPFYSQEGKGIKAICVAKYFHPLSSWTWYALEYDIETKNFFGIVVGDSVEYGNFSLKEMEDLEIEGLNMERDLYFEPQKIGNIDDPRLQEFLSEMFNKQVK